MWHSTRVWTKGKRNEIRLFWTCNREHLNYELYIKFKCHEEKGIRNWCACLVVTTI
jgi:hypothetical protein